MGQAVSNLAHHADYLALSLSLRCASNTCEACAEAIGLQGSLSGVKLIAPWRRSGNVTGGSESRALED